MQNLCHIQAQNCLDSIECFFSKHLQNLSKITISYAQEICQKYPFFLEIRNTSVYPHAYVIHESTVLRRSIKYNCPTSKLSILCKMTHCILMIYRT